MAGGDVHFLWNYEPGTTVAPGGHFHPLCQQHAQLAGVQLHTGTVNKPPPTLGSFGSSILLGWNPGDGSSPPSFS